MTIRLAVVTSGFPRRSETFALQELVSLEEAGMLAAVFATKPGDGLPPHPYTTRLRTPVTLLPAATVASQAAVVAAQLRGVRVDGVHGYFAHRPAAVAAQAARTLGLPHGFSVHARDARKISRNELARRADRAACVIACNDDVAGEIPSANGQLHVVPHGVDLERFTPSELPRRAVPSMLAVGRLVEKKGFHVLVDAAARLSRPVQIRIVGDGPERERLEEQITRLRLQSLISLVGGRTHEELPGEYAAADIVVAPSVPDRTGDRDGLPNVILEAMASARPVIASRVGAIASAVEDGATGWLVPPSDPVALAGAIDALLRDRALRRRAGRGGRHKVEHQFALPNCTRTFRRALERAYG